MEVEQNVATVEGEKKELDPIIKAGSGEEKMDVDKDIVKVECEEKENVKTLALKSEPQCEDLVKLVIEGIEVGDDSNEEFVIMSPEEIRIFLEQKISEHIRDPKINPKLALEKRSQELLDEIKDKAEEIAKLGKALDTMYRNQERFLRHVDIFPKVPTKSVSVSVDLPLLLDSVPLMSPSKVLDEEAVIKKDLSDAKVLFPTVAKNRAAAHVPPNSSPIPTVPSATSITPVPSATSITPVPSATSITPVVPSATSITPTVPSGTSITPAVASPNVSKTSSTAPVSNLPPKPTGNIECIDLTDDTPIPAPAPIPAARLVTNLSPMAAISLVKHPAPLPPKPFSAPNTSLPNVPPKPRLKVSSEERGVVLQWDMPPMFSTLSSYGKLQCFDIFGYQEQRNIVINTLLWKKIGSVKAMQLPMACTLTQFVEGQKYHFAVRAVDVFDRFGSYSDPISIVYKPNSMKKKLQEMT